MTPSFAVHPTSDYERLSTKLHKGNRDFEATERSAVAILSADPYNRSRSHKIKKLEDVPRGDGQYRLSVGGWRFRYDILAQVGGSRLLRSSPGRHVLTNRQLAARMLHIRSRLRLNRLLDPQNDVIPLTHGNAANISFKSASRSAEAISEGSGSTGTFAGAHSTTRAEWQGSLLQLAARTRAQVKTEASVLRRALKSRLKPVSCAARGSQALLDVDCPHSVSGIGTGLWLPMAVLTPSGISGAHSRAARVALHQRDKERKAARDSGSLTHAAMPRSDPRPSPAARGCKTPAAKLPPRQRSRRQTSPGPPP
jgi:hypothetical protein